MSGDSETSGEPGQEPAAGTDGGARGAVEGVVLREDDWGSYTQTETAATVRTANSASENLVIGGQETAAYGLDRASFNQGKNAKYNFAVERESADNHRSRTGGCNDAQFMLKDVCPTLTAGSGGRKFSGDREIFSGEFFVFDGRRSE